MSPEFDEAFWDDHYGQHPTSMGHGPNGSLTAVASDLAPGRALDAGCGEGRDATWLAGRGWQVTAVDQAAAALDRARAHADPALRVAWVEADLTAWVPPAESFDLVSSHYVHLPDGAFDGFLARLAAAVAPGGTLLVVGHDVSDPEARDERGGAAAAYLTPGQATAVLDPASWEVSAEVVDRPSAHGHGHGHGPARDTVLVARRTPLPA